jgi:UPF0755 protein
MQIEHRSPRRRDRARGLAKFFFFLFVVAALVVAGFVTYITLTTQTAANDFGPAASDLNPLEQVGLTAYLAVNRTALEALPSVNTDPVLFVVKSGENAATVSQRLAEMGLVSDADLLRYYMRYKGLDNNIEAGNFTLTHAMTIPQVAVALSDAAPDEIKWRAWEGWRLEQIAESLSQQPNLAFDQAEFMRLTGPGARGSSSYSFLSELPPNASLEGFLFPDTYRLTYQTSTDKIVDRMLSQFEQKITPQMRADATANGLTLYQVITLASIIEREGVHDDERPTIASVYLNRLAINMNLDADPTTQYAIATSDNWWPPLNFDPHTIDDPFNTYNVPGLPPGPIANPGLASINAVIYPAQTQYFYFRAKCDGSHYHNFAVTYSEQVANGCP